MARNNTKLKDVDLSPECMEAYDRLIALAHQLASGLTGDRLSPEGKVRTPRSLALALGMLAFLLRSDPKDLHALFFAKGSLAQVPFKPGPLPAMRHPPLAGLLR